MDGGPVGQGDPGRGLRKVRPESTGTSMPRMCCSLFIHTSCLARSFYSNSPFPILLRGPHCQVPWPSNAACPPLNLLSLPLPEGFLKKPKLQEEHIKYMYFIYCQAIYISLHAYMHREIFWKDSHQNVTRNYFRLIHSCNKDLLASLPSGISRGIPKTLPAPCLHGVFLPKGNSRSR